MENVVDAKQKELKIFEALLDLEQVTLPESMKSWISNVPLYEVIDIWYRRPNELPSDVEQYLKDLPGHFCDYDCYYDEVGNFLARVKLYEIKKSDSEWDIEWLEEREKNSEEEMQLVTHLKQIETLKQEISSLKTELKFLKQEIPEAPDFMKEWLNSAPLYELINNWYYNKRLPIEVKEYLSRFYGDYDDNVAWEKIGDTIARAKLYESEYGYYRFFGKEEEVILEK